MPTEGVILIVVVLLLAGVGYFVRQILGQLHHVASRLDHLQGNAQANAIECRQVFESTVTALVKPGARLDMPLTRLTFQESLDPERFAEASSTLATAGLNEALAARAADGVVVTVQSIRLVQQGAEMIVSASASGRRLLTEGRALIPLHRATGARLPLLTDAQTGKIIEQLKEMPISTVMSKLASISSLAIGAAHMVAGADLAKRLSRVESKLDFLLATHRIDQMACLERIYIAAQELSLRELDRDRRLEMWRLRGDLRELRYAWREELRLKLEHVEDPASAPLFQRLFATQRSVDQRVREGISKGEAEVALIEYSMRLEYVLAVGSDTIEEFQLSQRSELEQLGQLVDQLKEKAGYISGEHPDLSVDPMVQTLSSVVTTYRESLQGAKQDAPNIIDVRPSVQLPA